MLVLKRSVFLFLCSTFEQNVLHKSSFCKVFANRHFLLVQYFLCALEFQ